MTASSPEPQELTPFASVPLSEEPWVAIRAGQLTPV